MSRFSLDHTGTSRHLRGWKRQPNDPRDLKFAAKAAPLKAVLSLRTKMPAVRDQLDIGSCTANAGVIATEFSIAKQTGRASVPLSRLDLYASTRELEGTPLSEDSGCYVRDVFKASSKFGVCDESRWPYVTARFNQNPPRTIILESLRKKATSYHAVIGLPQIKACITEGYPIIFGFDCYESLMSPTVGKTGVIPLPAPTEAPIGGHCVTCVGYDDAKKALEIQNSWGVRWGEKGFGWLPYDYVTRGMASDFWTLRTEAIQ